MVDPPAPPLFVTPVLYSVPAEPFTVVCIRNGWAPEELPFTNLYVLPRVKYKVGSLTVPVKPSPVNV